MKVFKFIVRMNLLVAFNSAILFACSDNYGQASRNHNLKGVKDEPTARTLLKQAINNQDTWNPTFPGFTAKVIFFENDRTETGEVNVAANGDVQVFVTDNAAQKWLSITLRSIAIQRRQPPFAEGDGRYTLTLAPGEEHGLGRQVFVHGDGMNSSYRIKNGQIRQVNRTMQAHKLAIDVFENSRTVESKFLPTHFIISTYDKNTGELLKREECRDWYVKVGAFYLPHARKAAISEKEEKTMRSMKLYHFRLQKQRVPKHSKQSMHEPDVSKITRLYL